jgi:hypothetical protein
VPHLSRRATGGVFELRIALRLRIRNVCYPYPVEITFNIPGELARKITLEGSDPARVALEALALEGYRTERLSESAVRRMLGFETRMEVHAFLKQHGVYLHYDIADLEQDQLTAEKVRGRLQDGTTSGNSRLIQATTSCAVHPLRDT